MAVAEQAGILKERIEHQIREMIATTAGRPTAVWTVLARVLPP